MPDKHTAPFTDEEVDNFNLNQQMMGVYTCMSNNDQCDRMKQVDEGLLKATTNYLVCPCGKYKQYSF